MIISNSGRIFYTAHSINATTDYTYTSAASTGANDGWLHSKADHNAVAIMVATLAGSVASCYYRIEGRFDTYSRPVEIYSKTKTAVDTIDQIINVTEQVKELRVGVKVGLDATPCVIYAGLTSSEVK